MGTIARAPAKPAQGSSAQAGKGKSGGASTSNVCERELARASAIYNIPLPVLYAVGLQETGVNGHLQQYMLNIAGKDYLATSLPDAMRAFNAARAQGISLIDVGCLQVNYYYHGKKFRSVEQMFEPRLNVEVAAQELQDWRKSQGNWTMAVARYNASKQNVAGQKRYVCAVIRRLVETGMGDWTPEARTLCAS
ncbi:transglycosylase SLT domain-containing protein [Roseixanthobacter pseudopolyaromaticivorans]|uniref:transglycosylase SLT domain-containing protein n=1 Tax=Xanthobacteraceae TaxID=335928 RepID=UPI0037287DD7